MTTPAKNAEMPSNGPEKTGVAAAAAATADLAAAPRGDDKTATASQNKSQSDCDGSYICDCRLCKFH
ncbi:hypothetical protein NEMBOFW57_002825 [Staphylotrichum longicolle]|uniref:Uncharacterized protein n=1 Tax=Staphylotrichum longicolle TaxID=669026 RepID=A0AAD4F424_9PEZI|nr:hypothetical protein NEMBOFW57_002825 [Staphylotrichum longicolle]